MSIQTAPNSSRPSQPGGIAPAMASLARRLGGIIWDALPALVAGVIASLAATCLMLLLRLSAGIVTLPELVGERILPNIDANTFVGLLIRYGKIQPLLDTLAGQVVLGILIAPIYPPLLRLIRRLLTGRFIRPAMPRALAALTAPSVLAAATYALGMWLVALLLFWPVLAENLLGFPTGTARTITILGLLGIFVCYAAILALAYAALTAPRAWLAIPTIATTRSISALPRTERGEILDRRTLLIRSGLVTAGSLLVGGYAIDALLQALNARSNLAYEGMTTRLPLTYLTPNDKFYVVSKNVLDPEIVLSNWSLDVRGLVKQPRSYDLAGLNKLPQTERAITLECIANGVDGHLISNALWRGVTLAELLHASGGPEQGASQVVFTGVDGYVASLPLAGLLAAGALLAWEMNGAPLPNAHGFPLRAVVPGRFGEQSAKWVTRLELVDHPVKGFYQQQGWYSGPLYTISRMDNPGKNARLPQGQPVQVHGIAFGGTRGIQRVEVSTDGGVTWNQASFPPPFSPDTWVLWSWTWTPAAAGSYILTVRATDGTGWPQITTTRGTVPNGGTGLQRVPVTVV